MDTATVTGLAVGAVIGGAYAWFQLRSLRREGCGWAEKLRVAVARLASLTFLLVVLFVAPPEVINKWWFTGALVICYSVPFVWGLKQFSSRKK